MRTLSAILLCFSAFASSAIADEKSSADERTPPRYQLVRAMNTAVMIDSSSGESWYLNQTEEGFAWVPIDRLNDDVEIAKVKLNKGIEPDVDVDFTIESIRVALAKERADLRTLKKEFGPNHPKVLVASERVQQLKKIADPRR